MAVGIEADAQQQRFGFLFSGRVRHASA
jgi:hypothetical protein